MTDQTGSSESGRRRAWLRWGLGLLAATWLAGLLHDRFADWPPPQVWDEALGTRVFETGTTWHRRQEGRGTGHVGTHGILGVPDAAGSPAPKLFLWGDSHVEGMEVDDPDRMPQQVSSLWRERVGSPLLAVGVCAAGRNLADHYRLMPDYERVIPGAAVHAIFLSGLGDLLPDSPEAQFGRFVSEPGFAFVAPEPAVRDDAAMARARLLRTLHLGWFSRLAREALSGNLTADLRFRPGPVPQPHPPGDNPFRERRTEATPELEAALDWLLTRLDERTELPVVLVLAPNDTPRIETDRVVLREQPTELEELLAALCAKHGIGFVDLREDFNAFYRSTGRFPRGFPDSRPARGHLNADGHRLVAEALVESLAAGPLGRGARP